MLKIITLLLPFLVSVFWTVLLFLNRKRNSRPQNTWMVVMLIFTIVMGINGYYWFVDGNYALFYKLDIIESFATLLVIPGIYIYFRELTGDKKNILRTVLLCLPSIIVGSITTTLYFFLGEREATAYIEYAMKNNGGLPVHLESLYGFYIVTNEYAYSIFVIIQVVIVLTYATRRVIQYRRNLSDFFSNLEDKSIEHIHAVLWGLFILLICVLVSAATGQMLYINYSLQMHFLLVCIGIVLFYICYNVNKIEYSADNYVADLKQSDEEFADRGYDIACNCDSEDSEDNKQLNSPSLRAKLLLGLTRIMDQDKAFLQSDLRIDGVAALLNTNRTYISTFIQEEYHCNFSGFVNSKRIEYAKELIRSNPGLTQEHVAAVSGFTNPSTFSRVFKQFAGTTFREYLKEL